MKINEVIEAILKVHIKARIQNLQPNITIYMSDEFYHDCKREIDVNVNSTICTFINEDTICGHPVYRVDNRWKSHPSFIIANV